MVWSQIRSTQFGVTYSGSMEEETFILAASFEIAYGQSLLRTHSAAPQYYYYDYYYYYYYYYYYM